MPLILYVIKIGELSLKGGNKSFFERMLKANIKKKIGPSECSIKERFGRFYLETDEHLAAKAECALSTTFGVVGFSKALRVAKNMGAVADAARSIVSPLYAANPKSTFKVKARRTDKGFPLDSYGIMRELGADIIRNFPGCTVNLYDPDWTISVEIREQAFVYGPVRPGPGGLPVGCAGKGILLLSGGIDSPVAGYMMAKRGLKLDAAYFHTYPFTGKESQDKVEKLARIMSPYLQGLDLLIIPFTETQLKIKEIARSEEVTLLMRACMMRIAHLLALERNAGCLVTGESLSQVASQTMESLRFTGSFSELPVFRPLIGFDKEEIIHKARMIGTFDTSILPYTDCCSLFAPAHPLIRPEFAALRKSFEKLGVEELLQKAAHSAQIIPIPSAQ